jgi:hypothetical protein
LPSETEQRPKISDTQKHDSIAPEGNSSSTTASHSQDVGATKIKVDASSSVHNEKDKTAPPTTISAKNITSDESGNAEVPQPTPKLDKQDQDTQNDKQLDTKAESGGDWVGSNGGNSGSGGSCYILVGL